MSHRLQPPRHAAPLRALGAFVSTVLLALMASAALLWPDTTVQSVDSLATMVHNLGRALDAGFADY